jgi:hypothetical protein
MNRVIKIRDYHGTAAAEMKKIGYEHDQVLDCSLLYDVIDRCVEAGFNVVLWTRDPCAITVGLTTRNSFSSR